MNYRQFGKTDLQLSETGFGAWAIGGKSYGKVDKKESLAALAKAEELGCNFIDTAPVYGNSEIVLGEFLKGRRNKWLIATKYSGGSKNLPESAEEQLKRLQTDVIDLYQIHWVPREQEFYNDLYKLKKQGKIRYCGVSLYNASDIDFVLDNNLVDGFQVPFSLLDPFPFLKRLDKIIEHNPGVIIRSALKMGFLSGKFNAETVFKDSDDQRSKLTINEINKLLSSVGHFDFLKEIFNSHVIAAAAYPLSFSATSTLILGTKTVEQAMLNFGQIPGQRLSDAMLTRIKNVQHELGLWKKQSYIDFLSTVKQYFKKLWF
ncbi:MAG: aldo/keto reductase, partial [Calditrichaeota bacterium]|nr:aldo/keto reductase [Calditrichota bacterium]